MKRKNRIVYRSQPNCKIWNPTVTFQDYYSDIKNKQDSQPSRFKKIITKFHRFWAQLAGTPEAGFFLKVGFNRIIGINQVIIRAGRWGVIIDDKCMTMGTPIKLCTRSRDRYLVT